MREPLDWNGLCAVADRRNPRDRVVSVATIPAKVMPSRAVDCGFYLRDAADGSGNPTGYWVLRDDREMLLLRLLVAAGQVVDAAEGAEGPSTGTGWPG